MKTIAIIFLLFLSSCGAGSTNYKYDYFEKDMILPNKKDAINYYNQEVVKNYNEYKKSGKIITMKENTINKKYCAYNTLYFIYFNPWELRFSNEGYLEKFVDDIKISKIKDITIDNTWFTIGLIGFVCSEITAVPVYAH